MPQHEYTAGRLVHHWLLSSCRRRKGSYFGHVCRAKRWGSSPFLIVGICARSWYQSMSELLSDACDDLLSARHQQADTLQVVMQGLHTECIWTHAQGGPKEARCLGTQAGKQSPCAISLLSLCGGSTAACLQLCSELESELCTGGASISGCVALMASKTLTRILSPLLKWAAPRYQAAVGDVLRKHGLRYEDLYDPLLNQVWICSSSRLLLSLK